MQKRVTFAKSISNYSEGSNRKTSIKVIRERGLSRLKDLLMMLETEGLDKTDLESHIERDSAHQIPIEGDIIRAREGK